jgi:hypothetical protein
LRSSRPGDAAFDLLCTLVRPRPELDRARQLLDDGVDFTNLLQAAQEHSLRPQLIRSLAELGWARVPPAERSSLESFRQLHSALSLANAEQLGRIADALAARGIRFAAFKGVTLAIILYGDLSAREYTDVDLIVPAEALDAAEDVVEALDYANDHSDRRFRHAFQGYQRQLAFTHPNQATVDLHWDFTGSHLPFPLSPAGIWDALEEVKVGHRRIPAIAGADLALLLAGHGTKERWRSLGWVVDFAVLVERQGDLDWAAIHARAQAQGCGDNVLLACSLAERLLGVAVPSVLAQPLSRSARVRMLAPTLIDELRHGERGPNTVRNLADIDVCDRRWDRIAASVKLAMTPTASDYRAMPLPSVLWPLYRVTRPFRLAAHAIASRF